MLADRATQYYSVDKLILFGIIYTPSNVGRATGNTAKALLFYHLVHGDNIVAKVKRDSKKLRQLMHYVFEFAQARLQSDPIDGRYLLWFREPLAYFTDYDKEDVYRRIIEWLYNEFLTQIFGGLQWLSAT
jgi:hypothetical protein